MIPLCFLLWLVQELHLPMIYYENPYQKFCLSNQSSPDWDGCGMRTVCFLYVSWNMAWLIRGVNLLTSCLYVLLTIKKKNQSSTRTFKSSHIRWLATGGLFWRIWWVHYSDSIRLTFIVHRFPLLSFNFSGWGRSDSGMKRSVQTSSSPVTDSASLWGIPKSSQASCET